MSSDEASWLCLLDPVIEPNMDPTVEFVGEFEADPFDEVISVPFHQIERQ